MKVKICGVCRRENAELVVAAGADRIGVILAPGSPRTLTLEQARTVLEPAQDVARVGVFVDAPVDEILHAITVLDLNIVQLHGQEPPESVAALQDAASVWKAVRVRDPADVLRAADAYPAVDALLLDAWHPMQAGGTGTALDWHALAGYRDRLPASFPLILAGGLNPRNIAAAVMLLRPDGVDVSSGVEDSPGRKSAAMVHAFIAAARAATATRTEE